MKMKTKLRGVIKSGDSFRLWTGIPVGLGVSYAAGKLMPDFTISNPYLSVVPYYLPAIALGVAALFSPKTKRAGYGILGTTAAFYAWSIWPVISGKSAEAEKPSDYVDYAASGEQPPYTSEVQGAPVAVVY